MHPGMPAAGWKLNKAASADQQSAHTKARQDRLLSGQQSEPGRAPGARAISQSLPSHCHQSTESQRSGRSPPTARGCPSGVNTCSLVSSAFLDLAMPSCRAACRGSASSGPMLHVERHAPVEAECRSSVPVPGSCRAVHGGRLVHGLAEARTPSLTREGQNVQAGTPEGDGVALQAPCKVMHVAVGGHIHLHLLHR